MNVDPVLLERLLYMYSMIVAGYTTGYVLTFASITAAKNLHVRDTATMLKEAADIFEYSRSTCAIAGMLGSMSFIALATIL